MGEVYRNAGYAAARAVDITGTGRVVEARAKVIASQHRHTGNYIRSFRVRTDRVKGVKHAVVENRDAAAEHIEKGTKRVRKDGSIVRIPGQRIMLKTALSFTGGR